MESASTCLLLLVAIVSLARSSLAFTGSIRRSLHHALHSEIRFESVSVSVSVLSPVTTRCGSLLRAISNPDRTTASSNSNSSSSSSSSSRSANNSDSLPFAGFDYENRWYPCIWERDLEVNEPTRVTIFDVDYVVAKTKTSARGEVEVVAMKDYCTHKGAALSQGRVTENGHFQCAYHGWSFDGKTGDCVEIPQLLGSDGGATARIPSRACGDAVPAQIHQEMVWLFPGGGLEKALAAPPPPSLPDYDDNKDNSKTKMKMSTVVRDMPVDFPILVSNIFDPDHGLFAHQTPNLDMYAASFDCPFESFVSEETEGGGWSLSTKIDSKEKTAAIGRLLREKKVGSSSAKGGRTTKQPKEEPPTPWATYHFDAPTTLRMKRIDRETGETKFVSFFHICPVGVGRSRFLAGSLSKVGSPRWLGHLLSANFVDQDTYLLATQQQFVLSREADELRELLKKTGIDPSDTQRLKTLRMSSRRKNFCLASPSERLGSTIEKFWDATLAGCPNRVKHLLRLDESGAFLQTPTREAVLDRKTQSLDICKDSRDVVRNCRRFKKIAKILSLALSIAKIRAMLLPSAPSGGLIKPFLKTSSLCASFLLLFLTSFVADKWEKEYYFKYTDGMRRRDMKNIPKVWV